MALDDIEIGDRFRLLDSTAIADGGFAHAHNLRSIRKSTNRLVAQGEALLSLSWPSQVPASTEAPDPAIRAIAISSWTRAHPGIWQRPKKHGLRTADVFVRANVSLDERAHLAIGTLRSPPVARAVEGDPNVLTLIGTGALADYVLRDLPIDPGGLDRFRFFIRGQPKLSTVADPTDYTASGVATGQVASLWRDGHITAAIAGAPNWNWNSGLTWAPDHALVVHDGPNASTIGNILWWGQFVQMVGPQEAKLRPAPPSEDLALRLVGKFFYITYLPPVRIVHISISANDRSA